MRLHSRIKPRFTLSAIFILIAGLSVLLAWQVHRREEANRIRGLRERERYALRVLSQASAHIAVADNALLRKYRMFPAVGSSHSESIGPGEFTFDLGGHCDSYGIRRADWPVEDIKRATLTSLVEVVKDMKLLSSIDVSIVTSDCAVLVGDEGWIIWEFVDMKKRFLSPTGSVGYALVLEFTCRGKLAYETPLPKELNFYKMGDDVEGALQSDDAEDRLVAASHIRIRQNKPPLDVVLSVIQRENDPEVLDRVFQALELEQPLPSCDTVLLARLRKMLEQDEAHAALAARTILQGDQLFRLYGQERATWNRAAVGRLRAASIELLKNGDSGHWPAAAEELRRQMSNSEQSGGDQEAVAAMIAAIKSGKVDQRTQVRLRQALQGNRRAIDPLFSLVAESDQPEVWYPAAEILRAGIAFGDSRETIWERVLQLTGTPKYRMQIASGSHSVGYKDELKMLGDDAFGFLLPLVEYRFSERMPSLYSEATNMLAKLGDQRAVTILANAVEDHFRHGKLDSPDTAYGAASLVKAVNELTGENFGGLGHGPGVTGDEVESCDWTAIRQALGEYLQKRMPQPPKRLKGQNGQNY